MKFGRCLVVILAKHNGQRMNNAKHNSKKT
nr:MAG TPA: hypothetical protein [Caudoviricetes sp.]